MGVPRGLFFRLAITLIPWLSSVAFMRLLRWLPPAFTSPQGLVVSVVLFVSGGIFMLLALGLSLVVLFFTLTKRQPEQPPRPPFPGVGPDAGAKRAVRRTKAQRKQQALAQQQQLLWLAASKPQPLIYVDRHYAGPLWTIPTSAWPRDKLPHEHPPPSSGPAAISHKWDAVLSHGVLTLTPAGTLDPQPGLAKLEIALEGCSCMVVQECLVTPDGRKQGPWAKRGPLELSHPTQPLIYGDGSVFVYADTGAAKEQWYLGFNAEAAPTGPQAKARSMYQSFCSHMSRAAEMLSLPLLPIPTAQQQQQQQQQHQQRQQQQLQPQPSSVQQQGGKPGGRRIGFGWLARLVPGRRGPKEQQQPQPSRQPSARQPQRQESQQERAAQQKQLAQPGGSEPGAAADAGALSAAVPAADDTVAAQNLVARSAPSAYGAGEGSTAAARGSGGGNGDGGAATPRTPVHPTHAQTSASAPSYLLNSYDLRCPSTLTECTTLTKSAASMAAAAAEAAVAASPLDRGTVDVRPLGLGDGEPGAGTGTGKCPTASAPQLSDRLLGEEPSVSVVRDVLGVMGQQHAAEGPVEGSAPAASASPFGLSAQLGQPQHSAAVGKAPAQHVAATAAPLPPLPLEAAGGNGGHRMFTMQSDGSWATAAAAAYQGPRDGSWLLDQAAAAGISDAAGTVRHEHPGAAPAEGEAEGNGGEAPGGQAPAPLRESSREQDGLRLPVTPLEVEAPLAPRGGSSDGGAAGGSNGAVPGPSLQMPVMPLVLDWPDPSLSGELPLHLVHHHSASGPPPPQQQQQSQQQQRRGSSAGGTGQSPDPEDEGPSSHPVISPGRGLVTSASLPDVRQPLTLHRGGSIQNFEEVTSPSMRHPGSYPPLDSPLGASPSRQQQQQRQQGEGKRRPATEEQRRQQEESRRQADELKRQQQLQKRAVKEAAERQRQLQKEESGRAKAAAKQEEQARRQGEQAQRTKEREQQQHQEQAQAHLRRQGSMARVPSDASVASSTQQQQGGQRAPLPPPVGLQVPAGKEQEAAAAAAAGKEGPPQPPPPPAPAPQTAADRERGQLVAGLLGLNMLLTRVGYEILLAQRLERWLHRVVQKKLDEFKRPAYLHPLVLDTLDLGSTFPMVREVRAVAGGPAHNNAATADAGAGGDGDGSGCCTWPQLVVDLAFRGNITLVVSTSVEIQQAGLIRKLQRAFGKAAGQEGAAAGPPAPEAGATGGAAAGGQPQQQQPQQQQQQHASRAASEHGDVDGGGSGAAGGGSPRAERSSAGPRGLPSRMSSSSNVAAAAGGTDADEPGGPPSRPSPCDSNSAAAAAAAANPTGGGGGNLLSGLLNISRAAAAGLGSLAAGLTENLPRVPCQLEICLTRFECELMVWAAPPPSDRIWFCFATPPLVDISTRPLFGNRILRYSAVLSQVSALLKGKILKAINRLLVYPACSDIRLGFFANPGVTNDPKPPPPSHAPSAGEFASNAAAGFDPSQQADRGSGGGAGNVEGPAGAPAPGPSTNPDRQGNPQAGAPLAGQPSTANHTPIMPLPAGLNPLPSLSVKPSGSASSLAAAVDPAPGTPRGAAQPPASPAPGASPLPPPPTGLPPPAPPPPQGGRKGLSLAFRFRPFGRRAPAPAPQTPAPTPAASSGAPADAAKGASGGMQASNSRAPSTRANSTRNSVDGGPGDVEKSSKV